MDLLDGIIRLLLGGPISAIAATLSNGICWRKRLPRFGALMPSRAAVYHGRGRPCLNELVVWQRSHARPNEPRCASPSRRHEYQSVGSAILVAFLIAWHPWQLRPRCAAVSG